MEALEKGGEAGIRIVYIVIHIGTGLTRLEESVKIKSINALVAQWIEHLLAEQRAARSSRAEGACRPPRQKIVGGFRLTSLAGFDSSGDQF